MLGNYSWDAKLVLALSAFALNYGEFWLVAQNYTSNQLAKSMAILRQLLEILEHSNILKPNFDAINNLIKVMLDITRCIVEFRELTAKYKTTDIAALSMALEHIPIAVYWTTRSVVACASQIVGLTGLGHAYVFCFHYILNPSKCCHCNPAFLCIFLKNNQPQYTLTFKCWFTGYKPVSPLPSIELNRLC